MKIYDISIPIREGMHVYPGNGPVEVTRTFSMNDGSAFNLTSLSFSAHVGTHMDAPLHFIAGGKSIGGLDLGVMMGAAKVCQLNVEEKIERIDLEKLDLQGVERVLFKTRNSGLWGKEGFQADYVYITGDGARFLVEAGVKLVGIDYLSVQQYDSKDRSSHIVLLENKVVLLEGIDLSEVPPGGYQLVALPLKLEEAEGAPCRAVLIEE